MGHSLNSLLFKYEELCCVWKPSELAVLIMGQNFHETEFSQLCFHKVDKIFSGSFYKALKLWEIHDYIFTNVSIIS